jgi:hypothetical protein
LGEMKRVKRCDVDFVISRAGTSPHIEGQDEEVTLRLTVSQSVSQYVLVSSTLVGLATRYYFLSECCYLKFAVFLWGALSDERASLQFAV